MIEIPLKYQATFFGDMSDITPSAERIRTLLDMFQDIGLLPSLIQEFPPLQARLKLMTPDNEWEIRFHSDRIAIDKRRTRPRGENLGTPEDFAARVTSHLQRILTKFPKRAHRLSLVTTGLGREMADEKMRSIYDRFFKPLDFYSAHPLSEWSSRSVARVQHTLADVDEYFNVITTVSRVRAEIKEVIADAKEPTAETKDLGVVTSPNRLRVEFDINTFQGNVEQRFGQAAIVEFYQNALLLRAEVLSQVENRINE